MIRLNIRTDQIRHRLGPVKLQERLHSLTLAQAERVTRCHNPEAGQSYLYV